MPTKILSRLCTRCKKNPRLSGISRCRECRNEYAKIYMRNYYKTGKGKRQSQAYYQNHKKQLLDYQRGLRKQFPSYRNNYQKKRNAQFKLDVFNHYGRKCICCGENHIEFLSIDHSNGDGAKHRKAISNGQGGTAFYAKLKKLGFPENSGLQVLCLNCNVAKGRYGYCPHEIECKKQKRR